MLSVDQFWIEYKNLSDTLPPSFQNFENLTIEITDFVKGKIISKTYDYSTTNKYLNNIDIETINPNEYMNSKAYFIFECYDNQRNKFLCLSDKWFVSFDNTYYSKIKDRQVIEAYLNNLKALSEQNISHRFNYFTITDQINIDGFNDFNKTEYHIYYFRTIIGNLPTQTNFNLLNYALSRNSIPDKIIPIKEIKCNKTKYENLVYYIFFIFIIVIIILIILYRLYIC